MHAFGPQARKVCWPSLSAQTAPASPKGIRLVDSRAWGCLSASLARFMRFPCSWGIPYLSLPLFCWVGGLRPSEISCGPANSSSYFDFRIQRTWMSASAAKFDSTNRTATRQTCECCRHVSCGCPGWLTRLASGTVRDLEQNGGPG